MERTDGQTGGQAWVRLGARWIDLVIFIVVVRILVLAAGGYPKLIDGTGIAVFITFYLTIPVEALFIALTGTTPGKWLGNIRITDSAGRRPTYPQAVKRTCWVWVKGLGLGIPLLNFVLMWLARNKIITGGRTAWDEAAGTTVEQNPAPFWRRALVLVPGVAFLLLINIAILDYLYYALLK